MILITRPYVQAIITANKLSEIGINFITMPLSTINFLPVANDCLQQLKNFSYVLITSSNTISFINKYPELKAQLQGKKLLIVGEKSTIEFENIFLKAPTINELFNQLPANFSEEIIYLSGDPISFNTNEAPFNITRVICYSALKNEIDANEFNSKISECTSICLYSANAGAIFADLCKKYNSSLANKKIFCISNKVAKTMLSTNANILVAKYPNEDSMLNLLIKENV